MFKGDVKYDCGSDGPGEPTIEEEYMGSVNKSGLVGPAKGSKKLAVGPPKSEGGLQMG